MRGIRGIGLNGLVPLGGVACHAEELLAFYTTCTVGDTFDPTITLRAGCPYTPEWNFGNGDTATGTTIIYTGYADAGPHLVTLKIPDIAYWLTGIDVYNDKITGDFLNAIENCLSLTSIATGDNTALSGNLSSLIGLTSLATLNLREHQLSVVGDIAVLASLPLTYLYIAGCGIHGDIASLAGLSLTYFDVHSNVLNGGITGDLSSISAMTTLSYLGLGNDTVTGELADCNAMTSLSALLLYSTAVTGSLSDIPALDSLGFVQVSSTSISGGNVAGNPRIEYLIVNNCGWTQAAVDALLASLYANRAIYTSVAYGAEHYLNVSGTNAAPSGVYQNDATPSTGLEYAYKLVNDPDAEGFKKWNIYWTGGSGT